MADSLGATIAPVSRDDLNRETNARFWVQSGYKVGQPLNPNNPLDKAQMPVWMDVFRKVKAQADAGTLVLTYNRPEVAHPLADAEIASTVAVVHVDAAVKASDPTTAKQHAAAAVTATQVSSLKSNEAAKNQPPTVSPRLEEIAAREGAKTPPPPHAPAVDHIAHEQMQNRRTSKSPRERPSREVLNEETNVRFWNRTRYKRGQRLDMTDPQDRKMSEIWKDIFREVEREAREGRLIITSPDLVPTSDEARPPRPPAPSPVSPPPPRPPAPPISPAPPIVPPMPMQQPGPPTGPPMPQPWMQPWMPQPWRGPPTRPPMGPPMMRPTGAPRAPRPTLDMSTPGPSVPMERGESPPPPPPKPTPSPTEPTTEGAPVEGMSTKAKIALGLLGFGALAAIVYAATRKPSSDKTVTFRHTRAAARVSPGRTPPSSGESAFSFPPPRGGRF